MPLVVLDMYEEIRKFSDPSKNHFAYATSEDGARWNWANAFTTYVKTLAPVTPPVITLPAIAKAFHDTLSLSPGLIPMPSASDFAAAWQAAMLAIAAWDDPTFNTRVDTLRQTLAALFVAPSLALKDQLMKIATAFHLATTGITLSNVPNA